MSSLFLEIPPLESRGFALTSFRIQVFSLSESTQGPTRAAAQYAHSGHRDLEPAPIEPSWILEGAPIARLKVLHAASDQRYVVALWDCTAGRFRWHFNADEVVHILDGEVSVTDEDGGERILRPGDTALFPKGSTNVWHVPRYVRKMAVNRYDRPSPVEWMKQVVRRGRDELKHVCSQIGFTTARAFVIIDWCQQDVANEVLCSLPLCF